MATDDGHMRRWLHAVLPPVCVVCGYAAQPICDECVQALPWNRVCCPRCALPLATPTLCGGCLTRPPPWQTARCPFVYGFPVESLIQQFKFAQRLAAGRALARLAARWYAGRGDDRPDALVPVPLHWRRRLVRRYNQADEIAATLAPVLDIPVRRLCRRVRATPAQSGLGAAARRRNLRGAFSVTGAVDDLHLAIVDDVLTTGSTAAELTRVLLRHGAARVDVLALARAVRRTPPR